MNISMKVLVLCSAMALPLIVSAQDRRADQDRPQASASRRYEDSAHKVHEWNTREDEAYRRYLEEHHRKYHDFAKASRKEQNSYWKWRESHPDDRK